VKEILLYLLHVHDHQKVYVGGTGIATHLFYDRKTGRMTEIENPFDRGDNDGN